MNSDAEALKHNFLLRGFFKNRGYEDASELTQNEISNLPAGPPAKDFTLNDKELFEKADNARLKDEKKLKPAGEFLQDNKSGLAVVVGLGSQKGDTSQEQKLTLARAAVVREYLVKNFKVDDTRIKTMGLAKQAQTPSGELEIKIYPAGRPGASAEMLFGWAALPRGRTGGRYFFSTLASAVRRHPYDPSDLRSYKWLHQQVVTSEIQDSAHSRSSARRDATIKGG